jgi:sn-1 stearoyl-lipid 9-desaturase
MHDNVVTRTAVAPASTSRRLSGVKWRYAPSIAVVHLLAGLAFIPWFFSWTGVVLAVLGYYVIGVLGINIGYHRLLAHRSFSCPRWLERTFAILGVLCLQESPTFWVALHRQHHHDADKDADPHSPKESAFWAHIGWMLVKSESTDAAPPIARFCRDMTGDPFYAWLKASDNWLKVALASWAAFFVAGFAAVSLARGTMADAAQFGTSLVVWGAALRTVVLWHTTWSVNSATHLWGYRNYETPDNSRNNLLVALWSNGEGWHNNHHANPRSARHGHSWREPDMAWLVIRALMVLGLAREVARPSRRLGRGE